MDLIHVTARVAYEPDHALTPGETEVHGRIADGCEIDIVCHHDCSVVGSGDVHSDAIDAWLHDSVLVLEGGDGGPPRLVVPTLGLTRACIGEALRRWLLTTPTDGSPTAA